MSGSDLIPGGVDWLRAAARHRYVVVDVFTDRPLEGNQLGVFLDGRPLDDEEMQSLARELKFAETVFLLPPEGDGEVRVRVFTPATELPFAGHPVLGTAVVVGEARGGDSVVLETAAGAVPVALTRAAGRVVFARLSQPAPAWEPFGRERELLRAVGAERSLLPIELYRNGPAHVYIRLADEAAVAGLQPDMEALADLGVAANCFAGDGRSWKTRMFFPSAGIPEDPATGSAAGPLALHLARHGEIAFGEEIEIRQGDEIGRPSVLHASARGSRERLEAVEVGGGAIIVAEGCFRTAGA